MADVHGRLAQQLVAGPRDILEAGEKMHQFARGRVAEMWIRGVGGLSLRVHEYAHRTFGPNGKRALRWLAIDQYSRIAGIGEERSRKLIGRVGPVMRHLFSDYEQEADRHALPTQPLRGADHGRGDPFRVASTTATQHVTVEPRWNERRHGVEVGREYHSRH